MIGTELIELIKKEGEEKEVKIIKEKFEGVETSVISKVGTLIIDIGGNKFIAISE